jgi:hypothetical protein
MKGTGEKKGKFTAIIETRWARLLLGVNERKVRRLIHSRFLTYTGQTNGKKRWKKRV